MKCPYKPNEPQCMVDYLLNRGIEVRNDDEGKGKSEMKFFSLESTNETKNSSIPRGDIFANVDSKIAKFLLTHLAESPEFREGVQKLSKLLNIPEHPDPKQSFRVSSFRILAK